MISRTNPIKVRSPSNSNPSGLHTIKGAPSQGRPFLLEVCIFCKCDGGRWRLSTPVSVMNGKHCICQKPTYLAMVRYVVNWVGRRMAACLNSASDWFFNREPLSGPSLRLARARQRFPDSSGVLFVEDEAHETTRTLLVLHLRPFSPSGVYLTHRRNSRR